MIEFAEPIIVFSPIFEPCGGNHCICGEGNNNGCGNGSGSPGHACSNGATPKE